MNILFISLSTNTKLNEEIININDFAFEAVTLSVDSDSNFKVFFKALTYHALLK